MYHAPLKEIRFVLHQLVRDDRMCGLRGLEEYSPAFADAVLDEAASFAENILEPINAIGDRQGAQWTQDSVRMPKEFKDAYARFVQCGWPQLRAPVEHGGQGAPLVLSTAVEELWASANLAFKLCPMLTRTAIEALERCGSPQQKRTYLPKLVSGEWTGAMNLTEPQAGSDLGAIRTRAVADGPHYKLFGQKIFVTYGEHDLTENIIHMVLARIEDSPPGTKGISLFIVPKVLVNEDGTLGERNDIRCISIERKLGIHGSPTCVLSYGNRAGAVGYLVGERDRGLEYMFIMMNAARLSVGLQGYAVAERAYQQALDWARSRVQGRPAGSVSLPGSPAPIVHHADVKRMLMTMKACADAARAIALYGAMQLDLAEHAGEESVRSAAQARGELLIPVIKGWSTELGVELTSLGIQIHGGMGYIEETGAAQLFRDARIAPIYEGTTGIQAADLVGRKVARDGGAAMFALIAEMSTDLCEFAAHGAVALESKRTALEGIDLLRITTADLLDSARHGIEHAQAVAVPYLRLCGIVIGGWLMARVHAMASRDIDQDREFYAEQILPQAMALARVVTNGSASVREADPDLF
jgi:alkylation response protein AidB-like acyl-CoA dehydrogenase